AGEEGPPMRIYVVKKQFGDKTVLRNFYGEFPEGKVTFLTGPSGGGKTTILRLLSGLDTDYSGTMEGRPTSPVFLFQEDRLIESISVMSNLKAVNGDEQLIRELLEGIGLGSEASSKVSTLSGGMKRRVAIVRMLLLQGDAYFLDEPFTGLDKEARMKSARLISAYTRNKTVVVVSHDEEDALLLGKEKEVVLGGNQ
ncbi:MAG: ABC transporter ATP-binding protein, partial [Spirochaetales bacterium]|nr:ABC transporter ATP-binding protein [Candidatus Physcosoma equi]